MKEDNSLEYLYPGNAILFKSHLLTSSLAALSKAKQSVPMSYRVMYFLVKIIVFLSEF